MILLDTSTVRRKKFQNGVFALKTAHQIFVYIARENLKTQQSAVTLDSEKSRDYRDAIVFENFRFSKSFPFTLKRKAGVFKFL